MPQRRQATVEDIVAVLRSDEKPVYTMGDIADEFDVSTETIRRRMPEVEERDEVRKDQIGKANVYWVSAPPTPEPVEPTVAERNDEDDTDESGQESDFRPETEPNSTLMEWAERLRKLSLLGVTGFFIAAIAVLSLSPSSPFAYFSTVEASLLMIALAVGALVSMAVLGISKALQAAAEQLGELQTTGGAPNITGVGEVEHEH